MLNSPLVKELVKLALKEDLSYGDVTSSLTIPAENEARAEIVAKEELVVCGLDIVPLILWELGMPVTSEALASDGERAGPGKALVRLEGSTRGLLSAERTMLNFLQRCCGVATYAAKIVSECPGIVVLDTRKTLPGWRVLDKYAVSVGGARNHRLSLGDMIMVKNNHVDASPGANAAEKMRNCLKRVFAGKPFFMPVEVEVRSFEELNAALEYEPPYVMLDNMNNEQVRQALGIIAAKSPVIQAEVSGNVNVQRLKELREIGVACASMGAITTAARAVDISMRIYTIS